MRRVLHLIDLPGPGGAETVFVELATRLDRRRWHSLAAVPGKGWTYSALEERGLQPVITPIKNGSFDVRYLAQIIRLVRSRRVDLIHSHLLGPSVYGCLAGLVCSIPVICTFHGQVDVAPDERFRRAKFQILNVGSRKVVFVSESLRRFFLATTHLRAERASVIANGIDHATPPFHSDSNLRTELRIGPADVLVGAVGHIRPPKAYDVLLKAAVLLRQRFSGYRFVIVGAGQGTLYDELLRMRSDFGLDDVVTFAGFREDIHQVMRELDVYVISSSAEGFSLSTVQAMAAGRPVVATRCGGPEDIITDGVNGILVPPNSPEQLAHAVERLRQEPETRARLRREAKRHVQKEFSIGRMVECYEDLYTESVAGPTRSRGRDHPATIPARPARPARSSPDAESRSFTSTD